MPLGVETAGDRPQRQAPGPQPGHRRHRVRVRRGGVGPARPPAAGAGRPQHAPRALYAADAARVRSLTRLASSSATAARMCTVSRWAYGLSQATKSAPPSSRSARSVTLREREPVELGDDQGGPAPPGVGQRLEQLGAVGPLARLRLAVGPDDRRPTPPGVRLHGGGLPPQPEPALALLFGRDPVVS